MKYLIATILSLIFATHMVASAETNDGRACNSINDLNCPIRTPGQVVSETLRLQTEYCVVHMEGRGVEVTTDVAITGDPLVSGDWTVDGDTITVQFNDETPMVWNTSNVQHLAVLMDWIWTTLHYEEETGVPPIAVRDPGDPDGNIWLTSQFQNPITGGPECFSHPLGTP